MKEGPEGRRKFVQWGRMLTVPLAAVQGYGMLTLLSKQGLITISSSFLMINSVLTITAGAIFLMWLGELITEKGFGDGISLLIFAGIVARTPTYIREAIGQIYANPSMIGSYIIFFILALFIIAGVVSVNEARRNIPISYTKRIRGFKMYGGTSTYLPLNINPAGVMPIIFAMALLLFPSMFGRLVAGRTGFFAESLRSLSNFLNPQLNPLGYGLVYFLLVILFTYFYTTVTFDPKTISENLQKMGAFIPGIRPGEKTTEYLNYVLTRTEFLGAVFLGFVAILPSFIGRFTGVSGFSFLVGGTGLLIVVAVILETNRAIEAQIEMREYEKL